MCIERCQKQLWHLVIVYVEFVIVNDISILMPIREDCEMKWFCMLNFWFLFRDIIWE